ncbi:MAG: transposase [Acidimicrobiales bacterium]
MAAGYAKSVRKPGHATRATICYDPFHVVALDPRALDTVRRQHCQEMRRADETSAKRFKGARWCQLKNRSPNYQRISC